MLDPIADSRIVGLDVGHQLQNTLIQLRCQHIADQIQDDQHDHPSDQNTDGPDPQGNTAAFRSRLFGNTTDFPVKEVDGRCQQIGHGRTIEDRLHRTHQMLAETNQRLAAEHRVIK